MSDDDHVFAESNLHAYNEAAALNEQDLTADVNADQLAADVRKPGTRRREFITAVDRLVARLKAAERALELADEDHEIAERHNLARAEAAEAALAIRTQQLGQEAIRNAKLEAALADTRQALAMLWQHYLLPISDEQKAQVVAALADTAKKETNEDTNT